MPYDVSHDIRRMQAEKQRKQEEEEKEAQRRAKYRRNHPQRNPDTRAHRKSDKVLINAMRDFLASHFSRSPEGGHVLMQEIVDSFVKSRWAPPASVPAALRVFRRHAKSMIRQIWPGAVYSKHKKQTSFRFLKLANAA